MARIFISYAKADRAKAEEFKSFITTPNSAWFYDHVTDGTPPGEYWKRTLYQMLENADAVACILTENFRDSRWCAIEIATARAIGSALLPILMSPEGQDDELLADFHYADWASDLDKQKILRKLDSINAAGGVGKWTGGWPYPGMQAFTREYAQVFYGRSRELSSVIRLLKSPAPDASSPMITVIGPSGCGKSSLVQAGVVPHLALDSIADEEQLGSKFQWLALPVFQPGAEPMERLYQAIAHFVHERRLDIDIESWRVRLRHDSYQCAIDLMAAARQVHPDCQLLLVIDQFEQLIAQTATSERKAFVDALQPMLYPNVGMRALSTLRADLLDEVESDDALSALAMQLFRLAPLDRDALRQVVLGPAGKAGITFDPGVLNRILDETESSESLLPFLALSLEKLEPFAPLEGDRRRAITMDAYEEVAVNKVLTTQADAALRDAKRKLKIKTDTPVIAVLMKLVKIHGKDSVTKRVVPARTLTGHMDIVEEFHARRLIVSVDGDADEDEDDGQDCYSIAHETIFKYWKPLKDELAARAPFYIALSRVQHEAEQWHKGHGSLLHTDDLIKTMAGLNIAENHRLEKARTPWRRYSRLPDVDDIGQSERDFLQASIDRDNARRGKFFAAGVVVLAVVLALAGTAFLQKQTADDKRRGETITRLIAEGQGILTNIRPGSDIRALQQLLTANELANDAQRDSLLDPVIQRLSTLRMFPMLAPNSPAQQPAESSAVSENGQVLAGGGRDGMIWLWDPATNKALGDPLESQGDTRPIRALAFRDNGQLVSVNADGLIEMWDVPGRAFIDDEPKPPGQVAIVAVSDDGQRVACGYENGTVQVWDGESSAAQPWESIQAADSPITALAFSPNGLQLAVASERSRQDDQQTGAAKVQLWNPSTRVEYGAATSLTFPTPINSLDVSQDGSIAVGGWGDVESSSTLVLLRPGGAREVIPQDVLKPGVKSVAFSADGRRIVAGGIDNTVRIWDWDPVDGGLSTLGWHRDDVTSVGFSSNGQATFSASSDKTVRMWTTPTEPLLMRGYNKDLVEGSNVAFSPDGRRFAAWHKDGTFDVWSTKNGRRITRPRPPGDGAVSELAFGAGGDIATVGTNGAVQLWYAESDYDRPHNLTSIEGTRSIAFSPSGDLLAVGGDKSIQVWNLATKVASMATPTDAAVTSLAFSRTGSMLVYGMAGGNARVIDSTTGSAKSRDFEADGDPVERDRNVTSVAFGRNDKFVATASGGDDAVRVWDLQTDKMTFEGKHEGDVIAVTFSPDGHYVMSGGYDDNMIIWNHGAKQRVGNPLFKPGDVTGVATPDSKNIMVSRNDGSVEVWPGPDAWKDILCSKLAHNMSHDDWKDWVDLPEKEYGASQSACRDLGAAPDIDAGR